MRHTFIHHAKSGQKTIPISVICITRNRPEHLLNLLQSLLVQQYVHFELIIIDQSDKKEIEPNIFSKLRQFSHVYYVLSPKKGKSRGLNQAIRLSSAPLLAFTDDDCIVSKNWIKTITQTFASHPAISGIYGMTLPYKPNIHTGQICPCTFNRGIAHTISTPRIHWKHIGFGNNMAYRKSIFLSLGGFKEWLGPGSIGSNAEDAEFALRTLDHKKTLYYNPMARVYHDGWLNPVDYRKRELSYACGEIASYGYLALRGNKVGKTVIKNKIRNSFSDIKRIVQLIFHLDPKAIPAFLWFTVSTLSRFRGMCVALYYSTVNDNEENLLSRD